jgi:hypothetical protein
MSGFNNGEKKAIENLIKIIWISGLKKVGGKFSNSSTLQVLGARRR